MEAETCHVALGFIVKAVHGPESCGSTEVRGPWEILSRVEKKKRQEDVSPKPELRKRITKQLKLKNKTNVDIWEALSRRMLTGREEGIDAFERLQIEQGDWES